MKTEIALLLLLMVSITGAVVANEDVAMPDNMSNSTTALLADQETKEQERDLPRFEAVFAIVGLLAIAYFVLRQRKDSKGT